jgi:hypothetical protein
MDNREQRGEPAPDTTVRVIEGLDPDAILEQEFAYARDTAQQANGDRTQVVSLYLLLVGGVGSVLLGLPALARGVEIDVPRPVYAVVLLLLGALGLFSVLKLVRLRLAWYDSVLAMNQIKDYYVGSRPELAPALRWRTATVPAPGRVGTITFDLTMLVTLIDSLAVGAASLLLTPRPGWAALAALAFCGLQWLLYFRLLPR